MRVPSRVTRAVASVAAALGLLAAAAPAEAGYVIVNHDDWTFSYHAFSVPTDAQTLVNNITSLFTGDQSGGSFLGYSGNYGLDALQYAIPNAGHTWVNRRFEPFTLSLLNQYDGVFLGGSDTAVGYPNHQVIIDYVQGGGNVYIAAGTANIDAVTEAAAWNTLLAEIGLQLASSYNGITGTFPVASTYPLLTGVDSLYFASGNTISDLAPSDPTGEIIYTYGGHGMLAVGYFGQMPPPSVFGVAAVPEPSPAWLLLVAGAMVALRLRRRRRAPEAR